VREVENMYDYNVSDVINEIEMQRYYMRARYKIEPNKVILGKKLCDILEIEYASLRCASNRTVREVVGLPIMVDYENAYTIQVCFVAEEMLKSLEGLVR
jgi:hypothetical protein